MAVPWTFKDGVYELKIDPDKKIHNANKIKLEEHITKTHVQPNLNAGRKPGHGIKEIKIGNDKGRVGGVEDYEDGIELRIRIRNSSARRKQQETRNLKNTAFDREAQRQANIYTQITILRNALNKKNITKKFFNKQVALLIKRNRVQMPGLKVGEWNEDVFNKTPMRDGWPEGVSQESIAKDLKKNYAALKPAQKQAQIKGKGTVTGLGPKVDIGHPRQGAANLDMALQPRYHPTKGNQSIPGIPKASKAKLVMQPDGSLKFDRPIPVPLAGSRTNLRSEADLDTANVAHRPRHGLERAIIKAVKDSPGIKNRPVISLEGAPQGVKSAVLHNTDIPTADATMMQVKRDAENTALARKIQVANQPRPRKPPTHIKANVPKGVLSLKHVAKLRSLQIGGRAHLLLDSRPSSFSNSLRNRRNSSMLRAIGGLRISPGFGQAGITLAN